MRTGEREVGEKQLSFPLYSLHGVFVDSTRLIEYWDLDKRTFIQSYFIFKPFTTFPLLICIKERGLMGGKMCRCWTAQVNLSFTNSWICVNMSLSSSGKSKTGHYLDQNTTRVSRQSICELWAEPLSAHSFSVAVGKCQLNDINGKHITLITLSEPVRNTAIRVDLTSTSFPVRLETYLLCCLCLIHIQVC